MFITSILNTSMFLENYPTWINAIIIFLLILFILKIVTIVLKYKQEKWTKENTFIFVMLGDCVNREQDSGFNKNIKYINYSLVSDAVLIKRLATKHLKLDPNHLIIFAHGNKNDFDIKSITDEILIQLTIKEIYKTTLKKDDINFYFYDETKQIKFAIQSKLKGHPDAHIILFLDDHGTPFHFADSPFFDFYLPFMEIKHSSLCILNDSCYSGQTIDLLEYYFTISESLKSFKNKISTKNLQFITFIASELCCDKKIKDLKHIFSFIENCYKNEKKEEHLIDIITSIYKSLEIKYKELFTNDINTNIKDICFSNDVDDEMISEYIDFLSKIGINTLRDITDLYKLIFYFEKAYGTQKNFKLIYKTIKSITHPAQIVQDAFHCNNFELHSIIKILSKQNDDFLNNLYQRHPNHYIITSSHKEGLSPTFGTRRVDQKRKVIPGSPAMGAFIIEVLIFPNKKGISIEGIKKLAYETNDSYKEYAIQSSIGFKEWRRLFFTEWKSSAHTNKNFIRLDNINEPTIEEVMNSVDFVLAARFSDDDLETPIDIDPSENENGTQTSEKYGFIVQPSNKRKKRRRYRLIKKDQVTSFNGLTQIEKEKDLYYSDDEYDSKSDKTAKGNVKGSDFILATINYNERIDIKEINSFKENIYTHRRGFSTDFALVFRYELQQLTKNLGYPFNPNDTYDHNISKAKMLIEIIDWMSCFLSPWYLNSELNIIVGQINSYILKYKIPTTKIEDLFKRSFNVADQIVTPIYFNQETFKKDRLPKIK